MQQALNERIGVHTKGMSEEEQTKWLLNYSPRDVAGDGRADRQRAVEMVGEVPEIRRRRTRAWRWSISSTSSSRMAQVLGMSADDVFNAYVKKNEVNFKRQDSGYAVKDEADSKHI